jgi:transposase
MPAPTKLTPELQEKILRQLRFGSYVETAAECAGITRKAFYEWMKKGERGLKPYAAFCTAVNHALADAEVRDLATILKASQKDWTAAAWRLERRYPEKYGRRDRMKLDAEVQVSNGDELMAKLARLIRGDDSVGKKDSRSTSKASATEGKPSE